MDEGLTKWRYRHVMRVMRSAGARRGSRYRRATGSLPFSVEVGMLGMRSEVERHRDELIAAARRHRARNVRLFGSVATGSDHACSDVDVLVDFESGALLLDLADLKDEFERILRHSVDVLSSRGLKPRDEDIRREAVPL